MSFQRTFALVFLSLTFLIAGCRGSAPVYHIKEDIDFSYFKKVAVLPLDNLTNERSAGEIVRQFVISELLASGLVDVVVPGEVTAALIDMDIKNGAGALLNEKQIKALGTALKVEGIILGTVEQYGETRLGNFSSPEVTVTLMMADAGSGSIVWSITRTRGGAGFLARHFGAKSETMSETAMLLVREAIGTLAQ